MPKECLPFDEQDDLHTDWPWPWNKFFKRAWNAFCGLGPKWKNGPDYQSQPVPLPGYRSAHWEDQNGSWRPYFAVTFSWSFLYGFHIRGGFRWTVVTHDPKILGYYNLLLITAGFEYDDDGKPI
jgi:hypothetical protein